MAVEVTELDFVGAFCRATLKVRSSADVALVADFSSNLIRDLGVALGSHLDVALPPDRLDVPLEPQTQPALRPIPKPERPGGTRNSRLGLDATQGPRAKK